MWSSTPGWSLIGIGVSGVVSGILTDRKIGQWLIWGGVVSLLVGAMVLLLPLLLRPLRLRPETQPIPSAYGRAGDGGAVAIAVSGGTVTQNFIAQTEPVPPPQSEKEFPDMTLDKCVTSVLGTSNWYSGIPGQADRLLDLIEKIPQEAALSRLTVWGRRDLGSGFSLVGIKNNLEPIPPEYWSTHGIDEIRFLENEDARSRGKLYETNDAFIDLHVSKRQIEKIWPRVKIA
jgi:hypothetical protein